MAHMQTKVSSNDLNVSGLHSTDRNVEAVSYNWLVFVEQEQLQAKQRQAAYWLAGIEWLDQDLLLWILKDFLANKSVLRFSESEVLLVLADSIALCLKGVQD